MDAESSLPRGDAGAVSGGTAARLPAATTPATTHSFFLVTQSTLVIPRSRPSPLRIGRTGRLQLHAADGLNVAVAGIAIGCVSTAGAAARPAGATGCTTTARAVR